MIALELCSCITWSGCNGALKWFDNHRIEGRQKNVILYIVIYAYIQRGLKLQLIELIIAIKPHKSDQTTPVPVCGDHRRV